MSTLSDGDSEQTSNEPAIQKDQGTTSLGDLSYRFMRVDRPSVSKLSESKTNVTEADNLVSIDTSNKAYPTGSDASKCFADFQQEAEQYFEQLIEYIEKDLSPSTPFSNCDDAVFIKSPEKTIVVANASFEKMMPTNASTIGRTVDSYAKESIIKVANHSDELIIDGCSRMAMEHTCIDSSGKRVQLHTMKFSLLGKGQSSFAILGVIRNYGGQEGASHCGEAKEMMNQTFLTFRALPDDQQRFVMELCRGKKIRDIEDFLPGFSSRTKQKKQSELLEKLNADSLIELAARLAKMQVLGYDDYGL